MSNKPKKRGDQKALELKMARKTRITETISLLPPRTMIFCEGTKTEPNYLRELVELINARCRIFAMDNRIKLSDHIEIIGSARSTTSLFSYAVNNTVSGTREVWLVYDHDDFPAEQFNVTPELAKKQSKKSGIHYRVAWSNECFELWLLLHFILLESNISRADYMEKLVGYIPSYHKSATDIFSRLKDRVGTAIKNAKTIEGKFDVNATPSEMAPCTQVYRLVEELLRYV